MRGSSLAPPPRKGTLLIAGIRSRLTYSNVMATIAVFLALGLGTAWALGANSVKSKHIVNGQVKDVDLGDGAVTAAKVGDDSLGAEQIDESSLFDDEDLRLVGAQGQPEFRDQGDECPWSNYDDQHPPAGFFRDQLGFVHLQGFVKATSEGGGCSYALGGDSIFSLPQGYTPAKPSAFPVISNHHAGRVNVDPGGLVGVDPDMITVNDIQTYVTLDGITFRCAPSGANGCP